MVGRTLENPLANVIKLCHRLRPLNPILIKVNLKAPPLAQVDEVRGCHIFHDIIYENVSEEELLARQGAFKSEKRKKELIRLKKQEEKRQKRLNKGAVSHQEPEASPEGATPEVTASGESFNE